MKIFSLFNHPIAPQSRGKITMRSFPDGESYIKFDEAVKGEDLIFIDSLDKPNEKIMPLIFAAKTAKELGAKSVKLIAPYLAYMRQDKRFNEGEAVTSKIFAEFISQYFDALTTVDPHLHRYHDLSEIYSIHSKVVSAAPFISNWIENHVANPLLIGPDSESEQWVAQIAKKINAPYIVLEKQRRGDRDVSVSVPNVTNYETHTPVLVDDIISTGKTFIAAIDQLNLTSMPKPICIGVHALFAQNAYQELLNAKPAQVITCNTIA
ncbi:MAG: ribose-phosphate pyrophosphokinase, partial [Gammaproteobacteria bacterium]